MHDVAFPSPLRSPALRRTFPALLQTTEASQYHEMEVAFRSHGGLATAEQVTEMLRRHTDQPISRLARWIVDREVISIAWRSRTMLPLFQFVPYSMELRAPVPAVLRELAPGLADWEIALWFARPNAWLGEAAPVDEIGKEARAVFHAARADRYLAHA